MTLKGFGTFEQGNVLEAFGQRFIAGRNGGLTITIPTPASLGIAADRVNVPVKVHIRVNTTRQTSEWATDFIKRGRPFIFEILVNGGMSATDIATTLVAAFVEYGFKFNLANDGLPFTWSQSGANITLRLKSPYLSFQKRVELISNNSSYGVAATTTSYLPFLTPVTVTGVNAQNTTNVNVSSTAEMIIGGVIAIAGIAGTYRITDIVDADTVTVANTDGVTTGLAAATTGGEAVTVDTVPQEPTFDGKYLEENVRMSTPFTSDSYGISPDEKPLISGNYTQITFVVKSEAGNGIDGSYAPHNKMGIRADETTGAAKHTFTLYLLEGSDLFASGGTVQSIVTFLTGGAPTIATFKLGNGDVAASAAGFIA